MTELLAIPEWDAPPRTLDDWSAALAALGHAPRVERESGGVAWLEVAPLRLRGYGVIEAGTITAINFELHDPSNEAAARLVEDAAKALGWEVHTEGDDEEGEDERD